MEGSKIGCRESLRKGSLSGSWPVVCQLVFGEGYLLFLSGRTVLFIVCHQHRR